MEKISVIDVCERIIDLEKQNRDERSKPGLYVRESFFALAKLLSLEHKDKVQDFSSSTDRKAFEERWAKTRSELGL
jgi:hypothetical protein